MATVVVAGVMCIAVRVAGVTVNRLLPEIVPLAAVMVVVPNPTVFAKPFEPAALLMLATLAFEEAQVTCAVRFSVELSERIPVAVNCGLTPFGVLGAAGATWMDARTGAGQTTETVLVPATAVPFGLVTVHVWPELKV